MASKFWVTDKQIDRVVNWERTHECAKNWRGKTIKKYSRAYIIEIGSGIGVGILFRCTCGKTIDLTDYGTW